MTPTAVYRSLMIEIERRRQQLRLSSWQVDDVAGLQDGYYQKMLHADAASGRQARWEMIQMLIDALFPDGFDLKLKPNNGAILDVASMTGKLRNVTAFFDSKAQREVMSERGKLGAAALHGKRSPKQRSRNGRKAVQVRWKRHRERIGAAIEAQLAKSMEKKR